MGGSVANTKSRVRFLALSCKTPTNKHMRIVIQEAINLARYCSDHFIIAYTVATQYFNEHVP